MIDHHIVETDPIEVDRPSSRPLVEQRSGPIARYDARHHVLWLGHTPIPFRPGEGRNAELIELLGIAIRGLRGLGEDEPCPIRRSEHELLAELLDLDDPELRGDLRAHLALSRREAGDTVMSLRRYLEDQAILVD